MKSKLTLIVDGNWLLMSRLAVMNGRYPNIDELLRIYTLDIEYNKNFKIIMAESRKIAAKEKRKRKYNVESDEV